MNTYITLACLLAVFGLSQGSAIGAYGLGAPWGIGSGAIVAPAISTANLVKAAPIPVIRTAIAPVVTAPVLRTVAVGNLGYGGLGGLGGLGWGGLGYGGLGWGGLGWGGSGLGGWGGWGSGLGKHYG